MKLSDLSESERKVWEAALTGEQVDLRAGDSDPDPDSPERWSEWATKRDVSAEVIAALLIGDGEAASVAVRGVRLRGAHITGELNLEAATLRCPLALLDCSFDSAINFNEATAVSVHLSGSYVPTVGARQLRTRGDLRLDKGFLVSGEVDLFGAHIGGAFVCTDGTFSNEGGCALTADGLAVDSNLLCDRGFVARGEVRLLGAHVNGRLDCTGSEFYNPTGRALYADVLTVDQDMFCGGRFRATGEVRLAGAHIGGQLVCTGGQFSNSTGPALIAHGLTVDQDMSCSEEFVATGEVNLIGSHIGGQLDCTGGQFSNSTGLALIADGLTVDGGMFCGVGFSATGEVSLRNAQITGLLACTGSEFSNSTGPALIADGLTVDGDMHCLGFSATGEVSLRNAHIRGQLDCTGGQFSNSTGPALIADGLTVDGGMHCRKGFSASGEVSLVGAHITGQFDCTGSEFSNPTGSALSLERATVTGPLRMEPAKLEGILDLTAAKTSSYHDNQTSRLQKLRLDRFVYDAIGDASPKERRQWLRQNQKRYSPQIYEQLAAVYHLAGRDGDARRILIEKQRRRFAEGNVASDGFFASKVWRLVSRVGGFLLDWMVGYGYRTWLAFVWVAGLLVLGTFLFNYLYNAGNLTAASKTTPPPPFNPFFYTLDLLLPVASLHQRDGWVAQGAAQWCSVIFIIMGWILASAIVLSLTGLLKRDVK